MGILKYTTVGEHKGLPRLYLDGQRLLHSFKPGELYQSKELDDGRVVLMRSESGLKVSRRKRKDNVFPVVDFRHEVFGVRFGVGKKVRVTFKPGLVIIEKHHLDKKIKERETRTLKKLREGKTLSVASVFSGAGILDSALCEGLKKSKVQCAIELMVEREGRYVDLAMNNQKENHSDSTLFINADVEDLDFECGAFKAEIMAASLPCTGASRAGRTKGGLKYAEEHDEAGSMVYYFLRLVSLLQPSIILVENVIEYAQTASFSILQSVLGRYGYNLTFEKLNGCEFGSLENRDRLGLVAVSKGLGFFDMQTVRSLFSKPETIGSIFEDTPLDSERWKTYSYLDEKRKRDAAQGKGFSRDILTGDESHCKVLREGYAKGGSCETFVQHPEDASLSRLFSPAEHSAIKRIPFSLVKGEADSIQHRALGQSVIYTVFVSVAYWLGAWLRKVSAEPIGAAA
jgi:DNA (cytosine-5)-methyltransferase 1